MRDVNTKTTKQSKATPEPSALLMPHRYSEIIYHLIRDFKKKGSVNMKTNYKQLLKDYPDVMSLDQMRIVCHISKKTARLLLQNGYVSHTNTGKKTHTYLIPKTAVINYLTERDNTPKKFVLLGSSYAKSKYSKTKTHSVVFSTLEEYPDVLDVYQAAALAGVAIKTVSAWARKNFFESFKRNNAYHIPKVSLVEYLEK